MNIFTIPARNLKRKALRTVLISAVFCAGILSVVGLYYVSEAVGHSLEEKLTSYGANIIIKPKSDSLNVSYGGFTMTSLSYNKSEITQAAVSEGVRSIEHKDRISAVAPKLLDTFEIGNIKVAAAGVDWSEEMLIKNYWAINGRAPEYGEIVVGSKVAEVLNIGRGESVRLDGRDAEVSAILAPTGTDDDKLIYMNIKFLQDIKNRPQAVTYVEVAALCSGCPIDEIVAQIEGALPSAQVSAMQNVVKQRMFTISFVQKLVLGVSGVILVTACFMLAVFMTASVTERKSEIGILRSLGYSRGRIFAIFTFEAVIIGMLSGFVGFVSGYFVSIKLLNALDITSNTGFNTVHMLASISAVILLSIISSIVPALKASKTEPASAVVRV